MIDQQQEFIFKPGKWVGEGSISFSSSSDQLFFITTWGIEPRIDEEIHCKQEVKMEGSEEDVLNKFHLYDLTPKSFNIALDNEIVGEVTGSGIIDEKTIAWEFLAQEGFQGYEVYELQSDGEYSFHAEYASLNQFRTIIDGCIRRITGD